MYNSELTILQTSCLQKTNWDVARFLGRLPAAEESSWCNNMINGNEKDETSFQLPKALDHGWRVSGNNGGVYVAEEGSRNLPSLWLEVSFTLGIWRSLDPGGGAGQPLAVMPPVHQQRFHGSRDALLCCAQWIWVQRKHFRILTIRLNVNIFIWRHLVQSAALFSEESNFLNASALFFT